MEAFEYYCLPRRTEALLSLMAEPVSTGFDMLLACGRHCASRQVCSQHANCLRVHDELGQAAAPQH